MIEKPEKEKIVLSALSGREQTKVPFWLMRQAGRYLPEYREIRAKAGDFLRMVYDPELAAEVTLQPLRRFGMDAAIIFSDILVIPQAMGCELRFAEGEGPILSPVRGKLDIEKLSYEPKTLEPVYEALSVTCEKMRGEGFTTQTLIGFSGGPWTLACYMIQGRSVPGFPAVAALMEADPHGFDVLIEKLTAAVIAHLTSQIEAGAEVVQIFESWAGLIPVDLFEKVAINPVRKITSALKNSYPCVPVIGFPRGCGKNYENYAKGSSVDAVGLDETVTRGHGKRIQSLKPVQGNLDPGALLEGGDRLKVETTGILEAFAGKGFVFNLGHGVIKETPPAHVMDLARMIQEFKV